MFLPQDSEKILKFLINSGNEIVDINNIFNTFSGIISKSDTIFAIEKLKLEGLISVSNSDNYEVAYIALTPSGRYYFEEKESCSPQTNQQITINNSTGINVGDNNSIAISNGISFDEVRQLITQNNLDNKEILLDVVDVLQDCIENYKPIPKGKFANFFGVLNNSLPFVTSIGKLIIDCLSN